jgi:hypothetical protein
MVLKNPVHFKNDEKNKFFERNGPFYAKKGRSIREMGLSPIINL